MSGNELGEELLNKHLYEKLTPLIADIKAACSWNFRGIVIIGSFSQGVATVSDGQILSDLDMHVVIKVFSPLLDRKIRLLVEKHRERLPFEIGFGTIPEFLYRVYKSIEYYETGKNGYVICGPRDLTKKIRIRDPLQLPAWEGVRVLFNRALELLEAFHSRRNENYVIAKFYLGMAQAYLLFDRRYKSTYRERHDQILSRCKVECVEGFVEKYLAAYEYKMNAREDVGSLTLDQAIGDALSCLDYYLGLFLSCTGPLAVKIRKLRFKFLNPYHSFVFFWGRLKSGRFDPGLLFVEPCIYIWERGVSCLAEIMNGNRNLSKTYISEIIRDWKSTPQLFPAW